jgi:hypothetical protein
MMNSEECIQAVVLNLKGIFLDTPGSNKMSDILMYIHKIEEMNLSMDSILHFVLDKMEDQLQ